MPSMPSSFWSINISTDPPRNCLPMSSTHAAAVQTRLAASSIGPRRSGYLHSASNQDAKRFPVARSTRSSRSSKPLHPQIMRSAPERGHAVRSGDMALWTPTQVAQWLFAFITGLPFWAGGAALLLFEFAKRCATHSR